MNYRSTVAGARTVIALVGSGTLAIMKPVGLMASAAALLLTGGTAVGETPVPGRSGTPEDNLQR